MKIKNLIIIIILRSVQNWKCALPVNDRYCADISEGHAYFFLVSVK